MVEMKVGIVRIADYEANASIASRISEADDDCNTCAMVGRAAASSASDELSRNDKVDMGRSGWEDVVG